MALGNRGFAQGLAGTMTAPSGGRLPPKTGLLAGRENRLSELASGNSVTRIQELVDPARCRIWEGHNRDYAALNDETCADLIESFKAEGRQNFPAIVRRVEGDPKHSFEVICGARRHWTVCWMRAHHQADFKFLIERANSPTKRRSGSPTSKTGAAETSPIMSAPVTMRGRLHATTAAASSGWPNAWR